MDVVDSFPANYSLPSKKAASYFLFKLPKEFNINDLNGKSIQLGEEKKLSLDGREFMVTASDKSTPTEGIYRPVVFSKSADAPSIGPKFAGAVSMRQHFSIKESIADAIPQVSCCETVTRNNHQMISLG
jgi:hypothetical protein